MQALITIPVIDSVINLAQPAKMLTHDQILAELNRQIDTKEIKQVEVAAHLSIPAPRVAEMRKGTRRIQPDEMPKLAALLKMAPEHSFRSASIRGVTNIPILGKVAAGVWLEQSLALPEGADYVAYDNMAGDADTTGLFAVLTEGDSMNLAFPENAILICRHIRDGFVTIRAGDYVIVERENHDLREMTCKRIEIDADGDYLLVSKSSNPKHSDPIRVKRSVEDECTDQGINIVGKVSRIVIDYERQ